MAVEGSKIRVRFAPSPTGALHVGSARTALFNWFFAKHHGGIFILRIEDTDRQRSNPAFLEDIYQGLAFLGIRPDEGPYFQAQRQAVYTEQAERLLQSGLAIRQDGAIVFPVKVPQVTFSDSLRGDITTDTALFQSIVLIKSDGMPAYNFACVVDDALMKISHVIRGDDHIANTPKQAVLYSALEFPFPQWTHIPLIVGADRARLSKREGATSVTEYRKTGYLADAFVNYLALLGWAPGGDRELIPPEEIVRLFDLSRVRKSAAQFDQRKLDWLNSQYLKRLPVGELADRLAERLIARGWLKAEYDRARLERIAGLVQERLKVLEDIEEEHPFFFQEPIYQEEAVATFLRQEGMSQRLLTLKERLGAAESFETDTVEGIMRQLISEQQLTSKQLIHPVRVAMTGRSASPPLFETMSILGRPTVLERLEHAATRLANGA